MKRILLSAALLFALAAVWSVSGAVAHGYDIVIEPIGHWHVFDTKTLTFTITDSETGEGLPGANVVAEIVRSTSERVTERTVADGDVKDVGGGVYTLEYTATALAAYALEVGFWADDHFHSAPPVAFSTSKAGEEGIRVNAQGTSFVYQIRYVWMPGHIHASHDHPVTLEFEVMRGIPTGDDINWDRPWTNAFDHVMDAQAPVVVIESEDGSLSEEVTPAYMGRGIYRAERMFSPDEVGHGRDYHVRFTFVDPVHGAEVTHTEAFDLHAVSPH